MSMSSVARAPKRLKVSPVSKAKKPITSLGKLGFDESQVTHTTARAKMSFQSPVTLDKVFDTPTEIQVAQFYATRCSSGKPFDSLPEAEKLAWTDSLHDNTTLMGYIIYSQLFPSLLKSRIRLNTASYHWNHLDTNSEAGRTKLAQREEAIERLNRIGSSGSVFKGLPYAVDKTTNILQFMKMPQDRDDERLRFMSHREFSMIYGDRGEVSSSSVYSSSSAALGLLYFSTVILGRPCCLESIVLPLSVVERRIMEQRFGCPPRHLDGPIRDFQTNWGDVFSAIGVGHRAVDYVILERACEHKYVEGLYVSDAFAVFRASKSTPGDPKSIAALVESYRRHSKHGVDSGPVVGVLDVIRAKPTEAIGRIDGAVLGAICSTYGQQASLDVQARCLGLQDGASMFDASVSGKLNEIMSYFDTELWAARKRHKVERTVTSNLDPAGLSKKVEGGRMLDPTDPASVERMYAMLRGLSRQVWRPLKTLVGKALGPSLEYPTAFLQITPEEGGRLYDHAREAGVTCTDMANLYVLLMLSLSFQRSQVLREATLNEFTLTPDGTHYKLTFKGRKFKTASASSGDSMPVSHFNLSPDQSMLVRFISSVGHRFCDVDMHNEKRRLLVTSKGYNWTQADIATRYKRIGMHWLGIENFSPHICRTFWASNALNSGQVSGANIDDFSSYLQVSSTTLRSSYMAAGTNSAAHTLGNEVLGAVVNSACMGEMAQKDAKPSTKKLGARRVEFISEVRASLLKYGGKTRLLFRDLVSKRTVSQLGEGEKWFIWERTFFEDGDEKFFKRFVDAHVGGV